MTPWVYGSAAACGAALVALVLADVARWRAGEWIFKPLASALFVVAAFGGGAWGTDVGRAIALGLVFGAIGDVLLIPKDRRAFLAGLAAFLVGHVLYAVAFVVRGVDLAHTAGAALVASAAALVVGRWLLPYVDAKMKVPVVAYMAVISAMVALAYGTLIGHTEGGGVLLAAAIAFYASDLCVAREQFVRSSRANRAIGLPLYYGAQVVFALAAGG